MRAAVWFVLFLIPLPVLFIIAMPLMIPVMMFAIFYQDGSELSPFFLVDEWLFFCRKHAFNKKA